ncbi:hypothetical protein DYB35_004050 [Aphanomyces astaci]|uniref:PH domain-containing protein n=3 Tax=Aphanomyces astaci TaxID=112090 RepID=A0A418DJJ7_APHAT|nr:hypothetical protein DYB35_004050 [Aphanomyces astaci]
MEQLPRKVCVARKSPAHVLLRCRQLIDQDRKQPMEFAGTEVDALRYRLRVRMETMWEELKIPHIDRDTFISVHGGCLASMARQVQLLTVHHQCTLRVLHCIQVREDLLLHTTNKIRVNDVWLQSMIQASVAVVEAVEMWRDTMWYPHAFRSTHAPNYLIKMTTDCSSLLKHQMPSCPVLHPLDPPHRGTVHVGHVRVMAPTGRQWRGARILKDEGDTHAQVVTMHGQWATLNQFVPLLKWNTTPNDGTSIAPVKKARTIDDTAPCFVELPESASTRMVVSLSPPTSELTTTQSLVCYRLEHWRLIPSDATKPSSAKCFLHIQVFASAINDVIPTTEAPICTFQTPTESSHVPVDHVEWNTNDATFFVPGVTPHGATVVVTAIEVTTIWNKFKFLGQYAGPVTSSAVSCHALLYPILCLKPGHLNVAFCNDVTSSPLTTMLKWSCVSVPCRLYGHSTGYIYEMTQQHHRTKPPKSTKLFMCVLDNTLVVYVDQDRSQPVLRLDLHCVCSCIMDDSQCIRVQYTDDDTNHGNFVFQLYDGSSAVNWLDVLNQATQWHDPSALG